MPSTVRISEASHRALRDLAEREQTSLQSVVERAIENYRRNRLLEAANRQYASLRADAPSRKEQLTERELWDETAADGLDGVK